MVRDTQGLKGFSSIKKYDFYVICMVLVNHFFDELDVLFLEIKNNMSEDILLKYKIKTNTRVCWKINRFLVKASKY